jgi:hypothetical protein
MKRGNKKYSFDKKGGFIEAGINSPVYLVGTVNWGMAPSHRNTQRGPFQDGDTDVDFRLDPRVLALPFVAPASDADESFALRNALLQVFKPGNDTFQIIVTFGVANNRVIDVKSVGGLTMDTDAKDFTVRGVIQLRAADPVWSDRYVTAVNLTATVFGTPTPYPKPYPVPYGAGSVNNIVTVNYLGSWATYPTIQCTGPATDLTIVDGLGHLIVFDSIIPAGQTWTIDLAYGAKTVIDQNGVNQFGALNINSDIVNWGIFPDPTVLDGVNTISVSATDTTTATMVTMYYSSRYIGV